jgi:hypothetical protein
MLLFHLIVFLIPFNLKVKKMIGKTFPDKLETARKQTKEDHIHNAISALFNSCQRSFQSEPFSVIKIEPHRFILSVAFRL